MSNSAEPQRVVPDSIVGAEAYGAQSHDLWSDITPDESALVRAALVRAHTLSKLSVAPDEAYLRGIADALGYKRLQKLHEDLDLQLDGLE